MLTLDQFNYHLPKERIAHQPAVPRDTSRLLVVDRQTGKIEHHHFYDLPALLTSNDVLVRNNTKVIPARLYGQKNTGGEVEILLTKRVSQSTTGEVWECLTKPGLKENQEVRFPHSDLIAGCRAVTGYTRLIEFNKFGQDLFTALIEIGHTPIPPYIHWESGDEQVLREKYQTLYAKIQGSAAAPTAGLHFTPEVDRQLKDKGVQIEEVTLHVGLGTFLRVKEQDITHHQMHEEMYELKPEVAERLNEAKQNSKRIIAVGTTTTRVLESLANDEGQVTAKVGATSLYVYPPHRFHFVDAMLTNFHEPKSTLLMLVSAFVSEPNTGYPFKDFNSTVVGKAYQNAIAQEYRLLSFGDAMLIH